ELFPPPPLLRGGPHPHAQPLAQRQAGPPAGRRVLRPVARAGSRQGPICRQGAVIFATVGSHPTYSFERFLRALESLPGAELVVQYGPGEPPANAHRAVPWMTFAEIAEEME